MSQDQNANRLDSLTGPEPKTPADRARQIQQMQEAQRMAELAPVQIQPTEALSAPATTASAAQHLAMFDVNPVAQVNVLQTASADPASQIAYGKNQAEPAAVWGTKGADIEVTGVPWKIIPFGPSSIMDLKKPESEYHFTLPPQAIVTKKGLLLELTATPKTPGTEQPQKRAVLVSNTKEATLKGADWGSAAALKKGIESIPDFAVSFFSSLFKDPVKPGELKDRVRLISVEKGTKSAYVVKAERKSEVDGRWRGATDLFNNFGLKVPASNDSSNHDIKLEYYRDHFQTNVARSTESTASSPR